MLCKYSDIFGKPGEGLHKYRICNIAIVDLILTVLLSALISWWSKSSFICVFFVLMFVAIILHRLFCVNTTINKAIFGTV